MSLLQKHGFLLLLLADDPIYAQKLWIIYKYQFYKTLFW